MAELSKKEQQLLDESSLRLNFASEHLANCLDVYKNYLNTVKNNAKIKNYQLIHEIDYISQDMLNQCEKCLELLITATAEESTKESNFTNNDLLDEAIKAASVFFKEASPIIQTDSFAAYLLSDLTDAAREDLLWLLMKNQTKEKLHIVVKPSNSKNVFIAKWNPYLPGTPKDKTFCEITFIFSQGQPKVAFFIKEA